MWTAEELEYGHVKVSTESHVVEGYQAVIIESPELFMTVRYGLQHGRKAGMSIEIYSNDDFKRTIQIPSKDMTFIKFLTEEDVFPEEEDEPPYNLDEDKENTGVIL